MNRPRPASPRPHPASPRPPARKTPLPLALPLALLAALTAGPAIARTAPNPTVTAHLLADRDALVPGQTLTLGLWIDIEPRWHIYWRNPGDSGQATEVHFTAPEGFEIGPLRWPLPKRITLDGGLVNLGYERSVMLTAAVRVPADLDTSEPVTFTASANWLVCHDVCIPGGAEHTLTLPAAASSRPVNADRFAAPNLPTDPAALTDRVQITTNATRDRADASVRWTIRLQWHGPPPPTIQAFPGVENALTFASPTVSTDGRTTTVVLPARILRGIQPAADGFTHLITWTEPDGTRHGIELPVHIPDGN